MALIKAPVKGMKDILPDEMIIREYVLGVIKDTYKKYGFTQIETPCMESIENLSSNQGGENEKLIFKVMKRGEKLNLETAKSTEDLVDSGMRYDLTLPLARYYSNNQEQLPKPFKALQIGSVWRADRPQRGRFRQFTQCDIDILGDSSSLAEIELINATAEVLVKLGFKGFTTKINHRKLLKLMALSCGISEDAFDSVFITLDKLDKIGLEGVKKELMENGLNEAQVNQYCGYLTDLENPNLFSSVSDQLRKTLPDNEELEKAIKDIEHILTVCNAVKDDSFNLKYDPTLVRGMGYYTGPIFEIEIPGFGSSCGGGGRYDEMISKFTSQQIPCCGFSLGFERLITILMEQNFKVPTEGNKICYVVEKNLNEEKLTNILKEAQEKRKAGYNVLILNKAKNGKHQVDELNTQGYTEIINVYNRDE